MRNSNDADKAALALVQRQFEDWRCRRSQKREPIPAHLWQAAVELCKSYTVTSVCRQLRLSFAELKKRLSTVEGLPSRFVQIDVQGFCGTWHLECERADGTRLRVSGSGPLPAVDALVSRFLP